MRVFALIAAILFAAAATAEPLLQDGKSQLFQRVLMRSDQPLDTGGEAKALSAYYVFERNEKDGETWLRVAPGISGEDSFDVREAMTIPWNQSIILKFTTLGDADRLLIFDEADAVYEVIESEDPGFDAGELRGKAINALGGGEDPAPIVALGPELGVDLQQQFYMLPILEAEEAVFETGGFVNLVKIAVAKSGGETTRNPAPSGATRKEVLRDFTAGVVFVIDTTRSMGRYFGPVREAVAAVAGALQGSGTAASFHFGLVGFRDAEVSKGIEYRAKTFAPLAPAGDGTAFLKGLANMSEATTTTKGFNEDSFAGVKYALDELDWSATDARFVILITDAGPRLANDELSGTGMSAEGLASFARDIRGAHVITLHLKTDKGARTHDFARREYSVLSGVDGVDPLYFGVPKGDERALLATATRITTALASTIAGAKSGQEVQPEAWQPDEETSPEEAELTRRTLKVMKSMQLDYIGAQTAAEAPDVFEGWIADRDFKNQGVRPVEIRLLVNRAQLSDLEEALRLIIEKGEESGLDPGGFFRSVLGAAAEMSRRPESVARAGTDDSLADKALISELLEGLPYRSKIMSMDENMWLSMPIAEQQEFLDLLYEKLERYRQSMSGVDNWVLMHPDQGPDEAVYPMPLENLP